VFRNGFQSYTCFYWNAIPTPSQPHSSRDNYHGHRVDYMDPRAELLVSCSRPKSVKIPKLNGGDQRDASGKAAIPSKTKQRPSHFHGLPKTAQGRNRSITRGQSHRTPEVGAAAPTSIRTRDNQHTRAHIQSKACKSKMGPCYRFWLKACPPLEGRNR
jgi:hypothetical protein